jgi:hypothetical protein
MNASIIFAVLFAAAAGVFLKEEGFSHRLR